MELRAIEGRATIGLYLSNGTRIATMATAPMSQWDRAQFIVTACNSHAANLARIAELEAALKDLINAASDAGESPSRHGYVVSGLGPHFENAVNALKGTK